MIVQERREESVLEESVLEELVFQEPEINRRNLMQLIVASFLGMLWPEAINAVVDRMKPEVTAPEEDDSTTQGLIASSFFIPESFPNEKKAKYARQIFAQQVDSLLFLLDQFLDDGNLPMYWENEVGILNLIRKVDRAKRDNVRIETVLPRFSNLDAQSPHRFAVAFDVVEQDGQGNNIPVPVGELSQKQKEAIITLSSRLKVIVSMFPHLANIGIMQVHIGEHFYAAAHRHKPELFLSPFLNDPVAFIHEVSHTLEGVCLHPGFLKYADEHEYYLYLSEKVRAMYQVLAVWIDACVNSSPEFFMKDGTALFHFKELYGCKYYKEAVERLVQSIMNFPGMSSQYKAYMQKIQSLLNHIRPKSLIADLGDIQPQSLLEKTINLSEAQYEMIYEQYNILWNLLLADALTGKVSLTVSQDDKYYILNTLLNELDHFFVGPVQKKGGGLPTSPTQLRKSPLNTANIRVNAAFLRMFHVDKTTHPFNLIEKFDNSLFD